MPTSTDFEQTGRDANILNNYFYEEPPLLDENEYGRLGKLILKLIQEGGGGTTIKYGGRVDSVEDLPETGEPNQFYLVGLEDSENFDEYIWAEVEGGTGHWDRLGSVSIIIDDHLDPNSSNPVQNGIIAAAFTAVNNAINAVNTALATKADKTEIPDISHKLEQSAIAAEYDPSATLTDGDYVTLDGELYIIDSVGGTRQTFGNNLITPNVTDADKRYRDGYHYDRKQAWVQNSTAFISGPIAVTTGVNYKLSNHGLVGASEFVACFLSSDATPRQSFEYGSSNEVTITPAYNKLYVSAKIANIPILSLRRLSSHLMRRVTVEDILPDPVTVNSTGDIYIGDQLVRKVLTQSEYDALETKDPKVEYLIPEETEGE